MKNSLRSFSRGDADTDKSHSDDTSQLQATPMPADAKQNESAAVTVSHGFQLYTVNADGSELRQITNAKNREFGSPHWVSPNKIVCDSWWGRWDESTLTFVDLAGGEPKIDITNVLAMMPHVSPDGKRITAHGHGIRILDEHGDQIAILSAHQGGSPRWSPDGKSLAYVIPGQNITILDDSFRTIKRFGQSPLQGFQWSPDGKFIYFVNRTGPEFFELIRYEVATDERIVLDSGDLSTHVARHPTDGTVTYLKRTYPSPYFLYRVPADGSGTPTRFPFQDETKTHDSPCWSPDGTKLLFTRATPVDARAGTSEFEEATFTGEFTVPNGQPTREPDKDQAPSDDELEGDVPREDSAETDVLEFSSLQEEIVAVEHEVSKLGREVGFKELEVFQCKKFEPEDFEIEDALAQAVPEYFNLRQRMLELKNRRQVSDAEPNLADRQGQLAQIQEEMDRIRDKRKQE
ncbi:MAG: hypothetical protein R3C28_19365, partial [Pirellulaceae bacterium]